MAYASRSGRARTSATNPQAHAICDRCGARYNFVDLGWQFDWRGPTVQNLRILVCRSCTDRPQEQLRAIALPADPTPIINARPQDFVGASTDYRATSRPTLYDPVTGIPIPSTDLRVTQNCENRITVPYGNPTGLDRNAVMPLNGTAHYGIVLPVLSVFAQGTIVTVTCSAVHNLHTGDQVSVDGFGAGNGFFSVNVLTATVFTYETIGNVAAQINGIPVIQPVTNFGFYLENGMDFLTLEDGSTLFEQEGGP